MLQKINKFILKNNTLYIAIIAIFLLISLSIYSFPSLFNFLFNNILGNLLLILVVICFGYFDLRWAIGLGILFIILYQVNHLSPKKEGFTEWSQTLKDDFIQFEKTYNPNLQFDINIIQKQASPEEVEYLLQNNKWEWSDTVKTLYRDFIMTNLPTSMDPDVALDIAQTVYNETAVKELMSWNTKEGIFLLTGATIGHTEGLPDNLNNIVRCGFGTDASGNTDINGNAIMEKIVNVGYDGINGSMIKNITPVADADLPGLVPGFKFLKGACNPCVALDDPTNYSCPFSLNVGDGGQVSDIWSDLWGLVTIIGDSSGSGSGSSAGTSVKKNQFPLLNELKDELNKADILNKSVETAGNASSVDKQKSGVLNIDMTAETPQAESSYLNSNM